MDVAEKLMAEVYDNRHSYKEGDYIEICKLLKDFYIKVKGLPVIKDESKDMAEDFSDDESEIDEDWIDYSSPYLDDSYVGSYVDPY